MNDYRGLLIKKQRKELDISLEALSHGVCSPSYLSKIENNILVANEDIYNLLFKKLEQSDGRYYINTAMQFYQRLGQTDEQKLTENGYSADRISSGLKRLRILYPITE